MILILFKSKIETKILDWTIQIANRIKLDNLSMNRVIELVINGPSTAQLYPRMPPSPGPTMKFWIEFVWFTSWPRLLISVAICCGRTHHLSFLQLFLGMATHASYWGWWGISEMCGPPYFIFFFFKTRKEKTQISTFYHFKKESF